MPRIDCRSRVNIMASVAAFSTTCLLLVLTFALAHALSPDGVGLLAFKRGVLDSNGVLANWNAADHLPCNWTGVQCDSKSKRVITIDLRRCNLSGHIAADLGGLRKLHRLYLQFNNFNCSIPSQLANCRSIRTISLHHNRLSGKIPPQLGNCRLLQTLYLQNNMLSGLIPSELGRLINLLSLNLSHNELAGEIPSNGVLSKFGTNSFTGNIQLCGKLGFSACPSLPLRPNSTVKGVSNSSKIIDGQGSSRNLNTIKMVAIAVGAFLMLKAFCILYLLRRWLKKKEQQEINLGSGGKLVVFQGGTSVESSRKLLKCIGQLSQRHIIGEGGYGVVYKLVLKDSRTFAVKKIKQGLESVRGFEAELETIGTIKHRNLVTLIGYITSSTVNLLIYEYLPNGTLDDLLHDRPPDQMPVEWSIRHKIALGVAQGLEYLHHACTPRIVHRDVSSSNILLDADLDPHLSDFGLAKLIGLHDTHVTATVAGTFGYIAPEYSEGGKASEKGDVYSYGVLLLELLSGRRPADPTLEEDDTNLAGWVRNLQTVGQEAEVLENYLRETAPKEDLEMVLHVACLCISKNPEDRPSMKFVVDYFEKHVTYKLHPQKQGLMLPNKDKKEGEWVGEAKPVV